MRLRIALTVDLTRARGRDAGDARESSADASFERAEPRRVGFQVDPPGYDPGWPDDTRREVT